MRAKKRALWSSFFSTSSRPMDAASDRSRFSCSARASCKSLPNAGRRLELSASNKTKDAVKQHQTGASSAHKSSLLNLKRLRRMLAVLRSQQKHREMPTVDDFMSSSILKLCGGRLTGLKSNHRLEATSLAIAPCVHQRDNKKDHTSHCCHGGHGAGELQTWHTQRGLWGKRVLGGRASTISRLSRDEWPSSKAGIGPGAREPRAGESRDPRSRSGPPLKGASDRATSAPCISLSTHC